MAKKIKDTLVETPKVSYATKIPGETDLWIGSGHIDQIDEIAANLDKSFMEHVTSASIIGIVSYTLISVVLDFYHSWIGAFYIYGSSWFR